MAKRYGAALIQSRIESNLVHGNAFQFICCWKRRNGDLEYRKGSVAKVDIRVLSMLKVTGFFLLGCWGFLTMELYLQNGTKNLVETHCLGR